MPRFIRIEHSVINLDAIRHVHFKDHPIEPVLTVDMGGHPFELTGPEARGLWAHILETLAPETWEEKDFR